MLAAVLCTCTMGRDLFSVTELFNVLRVRCSSVRYMFQVKVDECNRAHYSSWLATRMAKISGCQEIWPISWQV